MTDPVTYEEDGKTIQLNVETVLNRLKHDQMSVDQVVQVGSVDQQRSMFSWQLELRMGPRFQVTDGLKLVSGVYPLEDDKEYELRLIDKSTGKLTGYVTKRDGKTLNQEYVPIGGNYALRTDSTPPPLVRYPFEGYFNSGSVLQIFKAGKWIDSIPIDHPWRNHWEVRRNNKFPEGVEMFWTLGGAESAPVQKYPGREHMSLGRFLGGVPGASVYQDANYPTLAIETYHPSQIRQLQQRLKIERGLPEGLSLAPMLDAYTGPDGQAWVVTHYIGGEQLTPSDSTSRFLANRVPLSEYVRLFKTIRAMDKLGIEPNLQRQGIFFLNRLNGRLTLVDRGYQHPQGQSLVWSKNVYIALMSGAFGVESMFASGLLKRKLQQAYEIANDGIVPASKIG